MFLPLLNPVGPTRAYLSTKAPNQQQIYTLIGDLINKCIFSDISLEKCFKLKSRKSSRKYLVVLFTDQQCTCFLVLYVQEVLTHFM